MSNITTITPIVQGMKGSVVAQVLNANFQNLLNEVKNLRAENELLKKTAMIGGNGNAGGGAITEDAVVNVMYDPQTIMAKTEDVDVHYTVNVKVMCGNKEIKLGSKDTADTFKVSYDRTIDVDGMICHITKNDGDKLSFDVNVTQGSIADGSFGFHITYRGMTYDYKVNVLIVNKDDKFNYAQGIFVSTIFTRSDSQPLTPTGGVYSVPLPATLDMENPYQGWSDGIPSGSKPLWTCHRKFTSNGLKPQDISWSTPILAMDSADLDVCFTSGTTNGDTPAEPLYHGDQDSYNDPSGWHNIGNEFDIWMATSVKKGNEWGPWSIIKVKGEDGSSSAWKNTIYKRSDDRPETPTATNSDFVDNPEAVTPNDGWHDVPDDNGTWWMSSAYIDGDTGRLEDVEQGWSLPVKVAGGSGQGVFISTVFKRSETKPERPSVNDGGYNEPVPESSGWYDSIPPGGANAYPVWESHRKFTSDKMGQDESWSEPVLMMDTANFDCCFCTYTGVGAPKEPLKRGNQGRSDGSRYNWHESTYATEEDNWMATCYKSANSTWGDWVITKIKGESGKDGNYTNYIFKSYTGETLDAPTIHDADLFVDKERGQVRSDNGQINNDECNQDWKDGPGTGNTWWMSCAVIDGTTNKVANGDGWSKPTKLSGERGEDGSYTEYKYAINSSEVDPPTDIPIDQWDDTVSGALHTISEKNRREGVLPPGSPDYTHTPSLHYMWMGMRRHYIPEGGTELVAGSWEYARVTGEKGEDGTKLKVSGTKDSYQDLFLLSVDENNNHRTNLPEDGDSWIVKQEMWVWSASADWKNADSSTREAYSTNLDPAKWQNCGGIVGPPGESQYLHIKYAKVLDKEVEINNVIRRYPSNGVQNTPEDCDYMGTLVSSDKEAPDGMEFWSGYTWSRFTGADGYGYEYIYKLSTSGTPYNVPLSADCADYWYRENVDGTVDRHYDSTTPNPSYKKKTFQDNDYIPSGWTDNPMGITETYPYEFMCKRVKQNGVWQEFTGQSNANTKAILYSYKGKDGSYEQHEWAIFDTVVFTSDMKNDAHWDNKIPMPDKYRNEYLWERRRTINPKNGSEDNEIGDWDYIRISGERGNEGTGIQLNGSFDTLEELFASVYENGSYKPSLRKSGDAYTVSGDIWTWNEANDNITTPNTDPQGNSIDYGTNIPCHHWRNGGKIQGDVQYIHIKYAHTASAVTNSNGETEYYVLDNDWLSSFASEKDGEQPSKFIGICYNNTKEDPDITMTDDKGRYLYKWSRYRGEDGIDFEMIYTRTKEKCPDNPLYEGAHAPIVDDARNFSGGTGMIAADPEAGFNADGSPKQTVTKNFQSSDFIPLKNTKQSNGQTVTNYNWTDNPMGPTEELPYEWACRRDKIDGVWTNFYGRANDTEYAFLYNKYGDSSLEINIPYGQELIYLNDGSDKALIENKVIEFVLSKDGELKEVDNIEISGVTVTRQGASPQTESMSKYFSKYTYYPAGNNQCNNPHIYLTNKAFELAQDTHYEFSCNIKMGDKSYLKVFSFRLAARNGDNGEGIIQYKIVADKSNLMFDGAGKLDMADDDGIAVSCYVMSGDTETEIDWSSNRHGYELKYKVDSATKTSMNQDNRAGHKGAFISKNSLNTVSKEVVITLEKSNNVCQTIRIPVLYDMGSRTNLFSKDCGFEYVLGYTDSSKRVYPHAIHNDNGFTAVVTSLGDARKLVGIAIQDNPNNPHYVQGGYYSMTGEIQINCASGNTRYHNQDVHVSGFTCSKGEETTESKRQFFCDININNLVATQNGKTTRNWSSWYPFEWRCSGYTDYPEICFVRNLSETARSIVYLKVRNLKIEKLTRKTDKSSVFDGLGETTSLAMTKPNLFEKSGSFSDPFLVYWDNVNYNKGITVNPNSNARSGITCTTIPYGYCGNTVLEICDSGTTANNKRWGSYMLYSTKVTSGQYYCVSWYQRSKPNDDPTKQPLYLNITNGNNLVPMLWTACGSGTKAVFGNKNTNGSAVGMEFPMTKDWTRQYMAFYYHPSGDTSVTRDLHFEWYYRNADDYINHSVQMTMPKLEIGDFPTTWQMNDLDRIGKPLRGPSAWKQGQVYEGGGPNDNFQDLVTDTNADVMYLCKVTHTATKDNQPGSHHVNMSWDASNPWQETEKRDFIAADVIYSDTLKSTVMSVVEANIDSLVAKKLTTQGEANSSSIEIQNGQMVVKGATGISNIVFGVNENGEAVLSFYDNNGDWQYDLGPSRINQENKIQQPYYIEYSNASLYLDFYSTPENFLSRPIMAGSSSYDLPDYKYDVSYYQFEDGFKATGNVKNYSYFDPNQGGKLEYIKDTGKHSVYNGIYYVDNDKRLTDDKKFHHNLMCMLFKLNQGNNATNSQPLPMEVTYFAHGQKAFAFDMYFLNSDRNTISPSNPVKSSELGLQWYLFNRIGTTYTRVDVGMTTWHQYIKANGGYKSVNRSLLPSSLLAIMDS